MKRNSLQSVVLTAMLIGLLCAAQTFGAPYEIPFKSGTILPEPGRYVLPSSAASALDDDRVHVLLQLENSLCPGERARLTSAGIHLLNYLPDRAYAASVPCELDVQTLAAHGIRALTPFHTEYKIHPRVNDRRFGPWSRMDDDRRIFCVEIMRDVPLPRAADALKASGFDAGQQWNAAHAMLVACSESRIHELADQDFVLFIDELPPPLEELNNTVRTRLHVDPLQEAPYNLSGAGVTIMVWDGGMADSSHTDFGDRMSWSETANVSDHATHTSGTVGGDGSESGGTYRGMAPAVTLISGQYDLCIPFCFYDSPNDLEGDYLHARQVFDVELTTNSVGANISSNDYDCEWLGDYEMTSGILDALVRQTHDAPMIIFWAAGNERNDAGCNVTSYGCMSVPSGAKNIITVGATNSADNNAGFTSYGPTDDGRVKPEVMATGVNVMSCIPGDNYGLMSGTSMACPAAAGVGCLITEQWHILFPDAPDPLPETMKALLINTANDLRAAGPDFQTGYGIVDAQAAVDQLLDGGILESALEVGEEFTHTFTVPPGLSELDVSLAWSDVPAVGNVIPTLVNDLNLKLMDPLDSDHFPWVLNPDVPGQIAVAGIDSVNICERVHVDNPASGDWQIVVTGTVNSGESQTFGIAGSVSLVAEWTTIAGQVQSAEPPPGIPGRVSVLGGSQTTWTESNGNYTLVVPRGPTYDVKAEAYGYLPQTTPIQANAGLVEHDFVLQDAQPGTVTGTVTNQIATPLEGVALSFDFPNASPPGVVTDASGVYLAQLPGGNRYEVTADYEGMTQNLTVDVPENDEVTLDIVFHDPRIYPAGPDEYGYYCYEIGDSGLAATFDYVSIVPSQGGQGTLVGQGETGNDWTVLIDLPFDVVYYGQTYDEVTISADGWVGMGNTNLGGNDPYINVGIPTADTPNGIICLFWDDLYPYEPTVGGEIAYYHDAAGGRFIVEHYNVPHFNPTSNQIIAQLIFYTQDGRPTVTGDTEFDMLYQRFDYVGPGPTVDADATIGMESPGGTDGLEIVYDGRYHANNLPIDMGTALRFTTGIFAGAGAVAGQISTVPEMADLSIYQVTVGEYQTQANPDGSYLIEDVVSRQYRVTAAAPGFEMSMSELITVSPGETTYVDFEDLYRLDPAHNLTGEFDPENWQITLNWEAPTWLEESAAQRRGGGSLDGFANFDVSLRRGGNTHVVAVQPDTFFTYQPEPPPMGLGFYDFWVTAQYDGGTSENSDTLRFVVLAADNPTGEIPTEFSLAQNYPNPFNPETSIRFGVPAESHVRIVVFDLLGRRVATVIDRALPAGFHTVNFAAQTLGSGVYFYRMESGDFSELGKMILIR